MCQEWLNSHGATHAANSRILDVDDSLRVTSKKDYADTINHKIDNRWLFKQVSAAFSDITRIGNLVTEPEPQHMVALHRIAMTSRDAELS